MFKIRCLYSLVWDGSWDGRERSGQDFLLSKWGSYARNYVFLIFNKHTRESYYNWPKKKEYNTKWHPSLFSKWSKLREVCFIRNCTSEATGWPPEQRKHPSCRQVPTGASAKTWGALFQSFQESLLQKQTYRTEHTYWQKRAKNGINSGLPAQEAKCTQLLAICIVSKCTTYIGPKPESTSKVQSDSQ